jgi:hypothetical protein
MGPKFFSRFFSNFTAPDVSRGTHSQRFGPIRAGQARSFVRVALHALTRLVRCLRHRPDTRTHQRASCGLGDRPKTANRSRVSMWCGPDRPKTRCSTEAAPCSSLSSHHVLPRRSSRSRASNARSRSRPILRRSNRSTRRLMLSSSTCTTAGSTPSKTCDRSTSCAWRRGGNWDARWRRWSGAQDQDVGKRCLGIRHLFAIYSGPSISTRTLRWKPSASAVCRTRRCLASSMRPGVRGGCSTIASWLRPLAPGGIRKAASTNTM